MNTETFTGILDLLTFGFSVIAAVLAIDTYALLRAGRPGRTWKVLIIASVVFVMVQVLQMSKYALGIVMAQRLSRVAELIFALALAYAFYSQRQVFSCEKKNKGNQQSVEENEELGLEENSNDFTEEGNQ